MLKNAIKFIRVRGRIIPIKVKEAGMRIRGAVRSKRRTAGNAAIGSALGAAAGASQEDSMEGAFKAGVIGGLLGGTVGGLRPGYVSKNIKAKHGKFFKQAKSTNIRKYGSDFKPKVKTSKSTAVVPYRGRQARPQPTIKRMVTPKANFLGFRDTVKRGISSNKRLSNATWESQKKNFLVGGISGIIGSGLGQQLKDRKSVY